MTKNDPSSRITEQDAKKLSGVGDPMKLHPSSVKTSGWLGTPPPIIIS